MDKSTIIGWISGLLTGLSIVPYAWRIWQRKTQPVVTTWLLLSLLGLAFLLTYKSSGAEANIWPAVAGFINPTIIAFLSWKRNGKWDKLGNFDRISVALCLLSLGLWALMRSNKDHAQYALYLAIIADSWAIAPTVMHYYRDPSKDRPGAWIIFALGWVVALFAITDHSVANYALPIYIIVAHSIICIPLIVSRLRNSRLKEEWI